MKKVLGLVPAAILTLIMFLPDAVVYKISAVEVFLMVPAIVGFPLFYTWAFPWWREPIGRALFIFSTGMALLVTISVLYTIFGDNYQLREQVRFAVFSMILVGIYYQLHVMVQVYRNSPNREYRRLLRRGRLREDERVEDERDMRDLDSL